MARTYSPIVVGPLIIYGSMTRTTTLWSCLWGQTSCEGTPLIPLCSSSRKLGVPLWARKSGGHSRTPPRYDRDELFNVGGRKVQPCWFVCVSDHYRWDLYISEISRSSPFKRVRHKIMMGRNLNGPQFSRKFQVRLSIQCSSDSDN